MENNKMNTVAYLRVSSEEQARSGLGIDSQKTKIIELAKEKKLEVGKFYLDNGLSGRLRERPGLNELLSDIENDGINNVLTYSLDRLARNLALSILIENEFKKHNIKLYTVMESSFDLDDPFQKFIKHTREGMAELEADLARLRTEAALRKKLARGEYPKGTAPLGFEWQGEKPHRTLGISKNSDLAKFIFKQYFELQSLGKVQRLLKEKGFKTARGKNFSGQTIVGILRNPIYKGKFKHSGVEGKINPIIHPRIFNQVQRILESKVKYRREEERK